MDGQPQDRKKELTDEEFEQKQEEKKRNALRELEEMGIQSQKMAKNRMIMGVVAVCFVLFLITEIGQCSKNSIMGSHLMDARKEYCRNIKKLGDCKGPGHFGMATAFFNHVIDQNKDCAEAYIFLASMNVMSYDGMARVNPSTADTGLLTKAREECNLALRYRRDLPDACYFMGIADYYGGNRLAAIDNMKKCSDLANKYYSRDARKQKEWQTKAGAAITALNGATDARVSIDGVVIPSMITEMRLVD